MITIPQEALEQSSLFQRMLANPEFVTVLEWLESDALAKLATCKDDAEVIRTAHLRWKDRSGLLADLQEFVNWTERAMEARKAQLAAFASGKPETLTSD